MTSEELRALAETLRDMQADVSGENKGWSVAYSAFRSACTYERILALLDANAAMVAALRQAAWHMGTDPDRNALVQAGHGWKTTSVEAADMIRTALALAEKQP